MRAIKNTKKHNKLLIGTLAVAVLIAGLTAVGYTQKLGPFSEAGTEGAQSVDLNEPRNEQVDAGSETKAQNIEASSGKPSVSEQSDSPSSDQATNNNSVNVQITNPRPIEASGSSLQIKTLIQTTKSGTCTLKLSKSGESSVIKTAATQLSGSISTCKGFDVSTSGLKQGSWQLAVDYKSSDGKFTGSTTESVTI